MVLIRSIATIRGVERTVDLLVVLRMDHQMVPSYLEESNSVERCDSKFCLHNHRTSSRMTADINKLQLRNEGDAGRKQT